MFVPTTNSGNNTSGSPSVVSYIENVVVEVTIDHVDCSGTCDLQLQQNAVTW